MHADAHAYVARFGTDDPVVVYDIGSRDVNGNVRGLFPNADPYVGVDITPGPCVDVVADASTWKPRRKADVVVCCEVFEHCEEWRDIVANAASLLRKGGLFVCTAAGPGRAPHSARDGGRLPDGEFYANVDPSELAAALEDAGFESVEVDVYKTDVRAVGVSGG